MRRSLITLYTLLCLACATGSHYTTGDTPIVTIKKVNIEDTHNFIPPPILEEFIRATPEYSGAVLLANELLGDKELRKRFEIHGYSPYVSADLNRDGRDEFAFVLLVQNRPILLIIKKTIEGEWREDFSMRLNSYAQIKLSEPSVGIAGTECIIVTNISLNAIYNLCWDGMKYLVVEF